MIESSRRGKCECCGRDDRDLYVVCSGIAAMSFAYCDECGSCGAEPYDLIDVQVDGHPEHITDWALQTPVWDKGEYRPFIEVWKDRNLDGPLTEQPQEAAK